MDEYEYRRAPSKYSEISEVNENDIRVRLLGRVKEISPGIIVLEDRSGKMTLMTEEDVDFKEGDLIRVFAKIIKLDEGFDVKAELIQKMEVDENLYMEITSDY